MLILNHKTELPSTHYSTVGMGYHSNGALKKYNKYKYYFCLII